MKFFFTKTLAGCIFSAACFFGLPGPAAATDGLGQTQAQELTAALDLALSAYGNVHDYEARFEKRENDDGALGAPEKIFFKFEKPFKIFMKWLDSKKKGLQIVYERGKNGNKLAIHQPGLALGLVPVVFLEQSSPWVREGSTSFDIEDAGIGTFLEDFAKMVARAAREGKLNVSGRRSESGRTFFDVEFPGSIEDDDYFASRVVAGFDETNHLPVYMELYDWEGNPVGIYEYKDVRLNVGTDLSFKKNMHGQLFKVYSRRASQPAHAASRSDHYAR